MTNGQLHAIVKASHRKVGDVMRFFLGNSPVISVTKMHDIQNHEMHYILYLDGKAAGCYTLETLMKKLQEVMFDV